MRFLVAALLVCTCSGSVSGQQETPFLPGGQWRVHDMQRPRPRVVSVPDASTTPRPAPSDAIVLFDGTDLSAWQGGKGPAGWTVADGAMTVNGTGDIRTAANFGDCQLHLEFATPAEVNGKGQGRGNSGVFFLDRYEVQVLDSFDNDTYADGQCAALYGQHPPEVNACRPPGQWQTYDIVFEAPRFADDGSPKSPAYVTVLHNGILVHHRRELLGPTAHRSLPRYTAHPVTGPLRLQDHGNPVRFRNIWIRPLQPVEPGKD